MAGRRHMLPMLLVCLTVLGGAAQAAEMPAPRKFALLAGCTKYANLSESLQLQGPANDVLLMRDLLVERFGFTATDIVILSEASGDALHRPTRANIRREFQQLTENTHPGDQVMILLSGHGSQQPQKQRTDPSEMKPDGLSEIFLPCDVGRWNGSRGEVENSIADFELHEWLAAIEQRGPAVWVIVDSCHSGTICRGVADEVERQVPADLLVPAGELDAAQQLARQRFRQTRGGPSETATMNLAAGQPVLVALYAAQAGEVTVERALPPDSADRKRYGLLTFTVNQVLRRSSAALTYNELIERVHAQYVEWGRTAPTPMVEGPKRDREVLGTRDWPGRSRILLKQGDDGLAINAGALLGMTAGSVLAVYPPAGPPRGKQPIGYVRVTEARTLEASVEPCEFSGMKTDAKRLPEGGACEVAFRDCGDMQLRVAVDPADHRGRNIPVEVRNDLTATLQKLAAAEGSMIKCAASTDRTEWLVRANQGDVFLIPAAGVTTRGNSEKLPPLFGPAPAGEPRAAWLHDRLEQIARARNLIRLASDPDEQSRRDAVKVDLAFRLLKSRRDTHGAPLADDGRGIRLYDGDHLSVGLKNSNSYPIDVTLLYVDSGRGISRLFPLHAGDINRIAARGALPPIHLGVNGDTLGQEHLVAIAVRARDEQSLDFSMLAQTSLVRAQNQERMRGGASSLESPLGRLMQRGVFGHGATRGVTAEMTDDYSIRVYSWHIFPEKRTKE